MKQNNTFVRARGCVWWGAWLAASVANFGLRRGPHAPSSCQVFSARAAGRLTWGLSVTGTRAHAQQSLTAPHCLRCPRPAHPQIIACASLFLAGKVNYDPHSHEKLANELVKAWFGKDNPELVALGAACMQGARPGQGPSVRRNAPLPAFWTNMYGAVLEAERALLYTVGFDFNVEIVHTHMARLLKRPRFEGLKKNTYFQQQLINIANDIYKKDSTLVLQVGGRLGGREWRVVGASKCPGLGRAGRAAGRQPNWQ